MGGGREEEIEEVRTWEGIIIDAKYFQEKEKN